MIVDSRIFGELYANFDEKMSAKSAYLLGTLLGVLCAFKWTIWAFLEGYTSSSKYILKAVIYTINILCSRSKAAIANSFFSINSSHLVVRNISPVV